MYQDINKLCVSLPSSNICTSYFIKKIPIFLNLYKIINYNLFLLKKYTFFSIFETIINYDVSRLRKNIFFLFFYNNE